VRVQTGFKEWADTWVGPNTLKENEGVKLLLGWTFNISVVGEIL